MSERPFLSIGEVLELVRGEFPDVTISKIRFLESQGLIDPERTPSGYRKFYEPDVERLRWILRQQKDHFLPLRVIKERIETTPPDQQPLDGPADLVVEAPRGSGPSAPHTSAPPAVLSTPLGAAARSDSVLVAGLSAVSMTLLELAQAANCDVAAVRELERYDLLVGRSMGGSTYYDEEALVVARLAMGLARHGIEPRHLRMYKTAADREAGIYEQVVSPLLKQRNPASRQQALEALDELVRLGDGMRAAFVRVALRDYVEG